jgi:hypothetical protein
MRTRGTIVLVLAAAAIATLGGTARAAVTFGTNLAIVVPSASDPGCSMPCTAMNLSLPSGFLAPGGLTSPVNGTLISWSADVNGTGTGHNIRLQVLRPVSGSTFTGIATSAPESWPPSSPAPVFSTSLPIQRGDSIGLQDPSGDVIYAVNAGATAAAWFALPAGPLADGSTRPADATMGGREVMDQAKVEAYNTVSFGSPTLNKKKGRATVPITVPNAGELTYSGTGARVVGPASVAASGKAQLTVNATGKSRKRVNEKGKARISIKVSFVPDDGSVGVSTESLTLRQKRA